MIESGSFGSRFFCAEDALLRPAAGVNPSENRQSEGTRAHQFRNDVIWSGTEFDTFNAWIFRFGVDDQLVFSQDQDIFSWPVHAGNVVPEPGTGLLLGLGMAGLSVVGRSRREATDRQTV